MFSESRKNISLSILLSVIGVVAFATASAQMTVDHCGQVLHQSGRHILTADLNCSGTSANGIEITANNVVFDLAGHTVRSDDCGGNSEIYGIYAHGNLSGVRIEGGTVEGFNDGVVLSASKSLVRGMKVSGACVFGIAMEGSDNQVETSTVTGSGSDGVAIGVGARNRVAFNDISNNVRIGVEVSNFSNDNVIEYNAINGNGVVAHEQGGIAIFNGTGNRLLRNALNNNFEGIEIESGGNTAAGNAVSGSGDVGVFIMNGSPSTVRGNTVYGRALVDMLDDQVACGPDTWEGNHFQTDRVHGVSDGGPGSGCIR